MVHKTRAIVLHKTNYSESSLVVQVYSLHFGRLSLIVHGAKKKKSRSRSALFEPLSILEIAGNFTNTDKLIKPAEIKIHTPLIQLQSSISKRLITLFLAEVIHKCIKETYAEKDLFLFIENSLELLDKTNQKVANFHLVFLMKLSRYLGFYPLNSPGQFFSLNEGHFTDAIPSSGIYLRGEQKTVFQSVLGMNIDECEQLKINSEHVLHKY